MEESRQTETQKDNAKSPRTRGSLGSTGTIRYDILCRLMSAQLCRRADNSGFRLDHRAITGDFFASHLRFFVALSFSSTAA
jgi:hypothetical protein